MAMQYKVIRSPGGMEALTGYGSDDEDHSGDQEQISGGGQFEHGHVSEDSDDEDSDDDSMDSAQLRAIEAEARLKNFGDLGDDGTSSRRAPMPAGKAKAGGSLLPSALSAFDEVSGPPEFLDPEATRPLASSSLHGRDVGAGDAAAGGGKAKGKQAPGPDFDISRLAPPLKGTKRPNPNERNVPASAVIEGKAKKYKQEEGPEAGQQYTAVQIAMLGGQAPEAKEKPAGPSRAMPVSDFLDKGVGGALLPRKAQDRKDKEKVKRMKGQSAIGSWKSEAEMVLRQQFDS